MFNYVLPIFCFGLVITGIVFLGILQASEQLKADSAERDRIQTRNHELDRTSAPATQLPPAAIRNSRD